MAHEGQRSTRQGVGNTRKELKGVFDKQNLICCGSTLHNESMQAKAKIKYIQWKCFVGFVQLCQTLTWNQSFSSLTSSLCS